MVAKSVRVTLCMIVRDEERNLEACLAPIVHLFDEIIVVDTGSADRTKEIAARFTPHVYDFPWCDDFSAARNESLKHATGDWIFWLDADDRVRPEQVPLLRRCFEQVDSRVGAYFMETMLPPTEPTGELESVTHPRLFRRHPDLRWHGRVHEQLLPDFPELGYQPLFADIEIDHVGYADRALVEWKARRKLRLLRMDYAVDPDNVSTLFHLGMALRDIRPVEASAHLLRLLQTATNARAFKCSACDTLAQLSIRAGRPDEALDILSRGLLQFPNEAQLLFSQATAHFHLQEYAAAARILEHILRTPPIRNGHCAAHVNLRTKLVPRVLAIVRRLQGRHAESQAVLEAVLQAFPNDLETLYNFGLLEVDRRDGAALQSIVNRLNALAGGNMSAGLLTALWYLRSGDLKQAGPIIDYLIAMEPRAMRPRMLRAEWLSAMGASLDSQIQSLRDILRIAPGNLETQRFLELGVQAKAVEQQAAASHSVSFVPAAAVAAVS